MRRRFPNHPTAHPSFCRKRTTHTAKKPKAIAVSDVLFCGKCKPQPCAEHIYIGRNVTHGARKHGIDIKQSPDMVSSKLPALRAYQHSLPAPTPPVGSFDAAAAARDAHPLERLEALLLALAHADHHPHRVSRIERRELLLQAFTLDRSQLLHTRTLS